MDKVYKTRKKPIVQLTSLLDLLFVMIFVSLLQEKAPIAQKKEVPTVPPVAQKTIPKSQSKPKPKPKPEPPAQYQKVTAVFSFYSVSSNPGVPSGKFSMEGILNRETQVLRLEPKRWMQSPAGVEIDMVPLVGTLNLEEGTFAGKVDAPDIRCLDFVLKRQGPSRGSSVAGKWVGSYNCYQGPTGLTLTLQ